METVQHAGALITINESGHVALHAVHNTGQHRVMLFSYHPDGRFLIDDQHDMYSATPDKIVNEFVHYGIVGFLDLVFAKFLIVIVERELAATNATESTRIWRIARVEAVAVFRGQMALSLDEEEHERLCVASVTDEFTTGNKYFSTDVDLTNGPQSGFWLGLRHYSNDVDSNAYFSHLNDNFIWNKFMLRHFLSHKTHDFVLPLICGHVGSMELNLDGPPSTLFLISRISRHRAGARYWSRGVDSNGHTSIEVETDVLVTHKEGTSSFCMVQGSVPLFWEQKKITDPLCSPQIDLSQVHWPDSLASMKTHFNSLLNTYSDKVYVIDLLDRHSSSSDTAKLSCAFEEALHKNGDSSVVYSRHVPPITADAIKTFVHSMDDIIRQHGYLQVDDIEDRGSSGTRYRQLCVIRINSLDCVDETSMAQYQISRCLIRKILRDLGVWASSRQGFDTSTERTLGKLWLDHANAISDYYTGTPMLFSSVMSSSTLGSWMAPVRYAALTLARIYMGHFQDYARQDRIDYFMGHRDEQGVGKMTQEPLSVLSASIEPVTMAVSFSQNSQLNAIMGACSDGADKASRGPQSLALKSVQAQIRLRRRLSYHELTQPWPLSNILLARKFTAPTQITTYSEFALALAWLFIYSLSKYICGYPMPLLIRRPLRDVDTNSFPAWNPPQARGISVTLSNMRQEQCKNLLDPNYVETTFFSSAFGTGRFDRISKASR
ncbi:hypothetical protein BASA60_005491 [Batrachochytrium salamandrivorans]|nr:hypothetical protein BASA60_005491 [Batrachochytrium salamandrivorans]